MNTTKTEMPDKWKTIIDNGRRKSQKGPTPEPEIIPMKENTDTALSERYVSMSNQLMRGMQNMNLPQKRIMALALAKIDTFDIEALPPNRMYQVTLTAEEYAESFAVDVNTAYEQLKKDATALLDKKWEVREQTTRGFKVTAGHWLYTATYYEGQGMVGIVFHGELNPHIFMLKREFTRYLLSNAMALRTKHAWRLFECLKSWETTGRWNISLDEFHRIMESPASHRKDFGQCKRRTLTPAIKELREKLNMIVEYDEVKAGKKVTGLEFKFHVDPQNMLPI